MKAELVESLKKIKEEAPSMSELMLFLTIDGIGGIKWREAHDYYDGRMEMSETDFNENQEYYGSLLKECVNVLSRFGVTPGSETDRANGDYWKWYNHWKKWMNEMSDEEWEKFNRTLSKKEPVDELLPKTKWNE